MENIINNNIDAENEIARVISRKLPSVPSSTVIKTFGLNLIKPKTFFLQGDREKADRVSYLGTPVFSALEFKAGSYKTLKDEVINYEGLFIDTALFTVTLPKNIISTTIAGRDGEVREYISLSDYRIKMRGLIVSPSGFPEDDLRKFKNIIEAPVPLEVSSEFLDVFGIAQAVITGAPSIAQIEGFRNVLQIDLELVHEKELDLILDDEEA